MVRDRPPEVRPGVGSSDRIIEGSGRRQAGLEAGVEGPGKGRRRRRLFVVGPSGEEEKLPEPPAAGHLRLT